MGFNIYKKTGMTSLSKQDRNTKEAELTFKETDEKQIKPFIIHKEMSFVFSLAIIFMSIENNEIEKHIIQRRTDVNPNDSFFL